MRARRRELTADEVQGVVDQISEAAHTLEESELRRQTHQAEMVAVIQRLRTIARQLQEGTS